jgi:hypothetical protein
MFSLKVLILNSNSSHTMKVLVGLIVSFILNLTFGQFTETQLKEFVKTASTKELVETNTILLLDGEYNLSLIVADKLLEIDPQNANFNYRKGFAMIRISTDNYNALPFLEKAANKASKIYDGMSPKETRAPIDSYFYLGRCYHLNNQIDKAKTNYSLFIEKTTSSSTLLQFAKLSLKQCDIAEVEFIHPKNHELINLGDEINSSYADYSSVISFDGQALYFTSRRLRSDSSNIAIKEPFTNAYKEDVYVSFKDKHGNWQTPQLLDFCLPERNEATVAVSSDERSVYIYMDKTGNGDIYKSDFKDQKFGAIQTIDIGGLNTDYWEPHVSVSVDGNVKYFSSDRPGGYGGRDIYRIVKLPNGKWSEPQNLGPTINTKYDEDAPFISIDNKTLYFASNGEKSMGGFDVFVTLLDENNNWSLPVNLGFPLNSTGDDIYYTTTANGRVGYLSSFRAGGNGEKDIYEIRNDYFSMDNIAVLKGKIITVDNVDLPEDVAFTLNCLDCGQKSEHIVRPKLTDGSNSFISSLEPCRRYEMIFHYNNEDTEFYREVFTTSCDRGYEEIYREILLDVPTMTVIQPPSDDDAVYAFQPLKFEHYFGYNNNKITAKTGELNHYMQLIIEQIAQGRDAITIEVNASASKVPTRKFKNNMLLAQTRAENIASELETYIQSQPSLQGKVSVVINKVGVGGPQYRYGTHMDISTYAPYQFIQLTVQGVSETEELEPNIINSQDFELKGKL